MYQKTPEDIGNTGALLGMYLSLLGAPAGSADANTAGAPATDASKRAAVLDKARKLGDDAVKRWPNEPRFVVAAAQVKLASGDFSGGERLIKDFADANPTW